jgi:gliding motility-associated lipoprotein GldD
MGNMEQRNNEFMKYLSFLFIALFFVSACHSNSNDYTPKPRGYFRIVFPKKEYQRFDSSYPFSFLYPKYAVIENDSNLAKDKKYIDPKHKRLLNMKYLMNMQFPQFHGTLHLSYESITSKEVFEKLIEDSHSFAYKHTVKASGIRQELIYNPQAKIFGIYYTIGGNAASSAQFFLTDSTRNYIRGALYFNSEPRLDSIQPVLDFVKKDMDVMIGSFKWKN